MFRCLCTFFDCFDPSTKIQIDARRSFANVIPILFPKRFNKVDGRRETRVDSGTICEARGRKWNLSSLSVVLVAGECSGRRSSSSSGALSGRNSHEAFVKYSTGRPCCVYSTGDTVLPCNSCIQRAHSIKDPNIIFPRILRNCCFSITFEPPV